MKNFLKGIIIGIATLIPGVSGGTMAIILGIYDDLIHSISSFFNDWKKHSMFLIQIALGIVLAFILFSKVILISLEKIPMEMGFLFLGVIAGGLPVLYKKANSIKGSYTDLIFLIIGFILVFILSGGDTTVATNSTVTGFVNILLLFIAGIIVAVALVLPGISGSFMLLSLGLYNITLKSINEFNIPFLIPLCLGIAVGTVLTTKSIEKLLNNYPRKTYLLIIGFVVASAVPVFPGIPTGIHIITSLFLCVLGFVFIYFLNYNNN